MKKVFQPGDLVITLQSLVNVGNHLIKRNRWNWSRTQYGQITRDEFVGIVASSMPNLPFECPVGQDAHVSAVYIVTPGMIGWVGEVMTLNLRLQNEK